MSALIIGVTRQRGPWTCAAAALVLFGLGVQGIRTARQLGVYPQEKANADMRRSPNWSAA
jgi:hypothetical protein